MSIFSKIIKGEIPCHKISENDFFISFLDIEPIVRGHVLVVPKIEVNKFYHLPKEYLIELMLFARPLALAIEKSFPCKRCGFSIIGLEVPHAHLHLVPIQTADDLNFTRPKLVVSMTDLEKDQKTILSNLN